jgi:hypothetical protein
VRAFSNLCVCVCLRIFKSVRMPKSVRMRLFAYASVRFSHEQVGILVLKEEVCQNRGRQGDILYPWGFMLSTSQATLSDKSSLL